MAVFLFDRISTFARQNFSYWRVAGANLEQPVTPFHFAGQELLQPDV
jgi:hypothetical protein